MVGILNAKRSKILEEDYSPHFSVAAIHKDLGLAFQMLGELGKESWTGTGPALLFHLAHQRGFGDKDLSVIYELVRQGHIYKPETES